MRAAGASRREPFAPPPGRSVGELSRLWHVIKRRTRLGARILVLYLINMLPLDGRAKQIARIIVIILGVVSLLKYLTVF
jgi:hypothetical protein